MHFADSVTNLFTHFCITLQCQCWCRHRVGIADLSWWGRLRRHCSASSSPQLRPKVRFLPHRSSPGSPSERESTWARTMEFDHLPQCHSTGMLKVFFTGQWGKRAGDPNSLILLIWKCAATSENGSEQSGCWQEDVIISYGTVVAGDWANIVLKAQLICSDESVAFVMHSVPCTLYLWSCSHCTAQCYY